MTNLHDEIEDNLQRAYSAGWRGCLNRKVDDERSRRLVQDIIENDMVEAKTAILAHIQAEVLAGLESVRDEGFQRYKENPLKHSQTEATTRALYDRLARLKATNEEVGE